MSIKEETHGENNITTNHIIAHNAPSTVGSSHKTWPNRSFHDVRENGSLPYEEEQEHYQYREKQDENYSRDYYHDKEKFEENEQESSQEEDENEEENEVKYNEEEFERAEHLLLLHSDGDIINHNDDNEKWKTNNTSQSLMIDDLGDRTKLLYHITYLNTQLQRLQLQNEELKRSLTLVVGMLRRTPHLIAENRKVERRSLESTPKSSAHDEEKEEEKKENGEENENVKEKGCTVVVSPTALTACLIASHDERNVEMQLQQSLMKFDPFIAQTHIYKLDSTIAQLSMLRQVEVERLVKCEEELHHLHESHDQLVAQLSKAETYSQQIEHKYNVEHDSCRALQLEVEQLRLTERQLLARLQELESFRGIYSATSKSNHNNKVKTTAHFTETSSIVNHNSDKYNEKPNKWSESVEWAERCARQELLQEMFWTPMCIAFDAGLTWVNEVAAKDNNKGNDNNNDTVESVHEENRNTLQKVHQMDDENNNVGYTSLDAPISDVDLLVMQSLQEDVTAVRSELAACKADLSTAQLNMTRYQSLYTSERAKNITMQNEFCNQMERILEEVENDRQVIMNALQGQLQSVLTKQETSKSSTSTNSKTTAVVKKVNKDSDKENTVPQSLRKKQEQEQEEYEEE